MRSGLCRSKGAERSEARLAASAGVAAVCLLLSSAPLVSAVNIFPTALDSITIAGNFGTLRPLSGWEGGASLGSPSSIANGVFLPESTQWNSGSWWWDQDPSVNPGPVYTILNLDQAYTIDGFTVQADNNDIYRLEYWTGSAWQLAWDAPIVGGWGLTTRASGPLTAFSTDSLRVTAIGVDDLFFGVSEIQAEGTPTVPEPGTLLLLGAGLVGLSRFRRRR